VTTTAGTLAVIVGVGVALLALIAGWRHGYAEGFRAGRAEGWRRHEAIVNDQRRPWSADA